MIDRKVTVAAFFESVFLPGLGSIGKSIPVNNRTESKNWEMTTNALGLVIKTPRVSINNQGGEFLVPWANVSSVQLATKAVEQITLGKTQASDAKTQ